VGGRLESNKWIGDVERGNQASSRIQLDARCSLPFTQSPPFPWAPTNDA
jgi:hypothetical protein